MGVIYLIRHGQASYGDDHHGQLSDLGVRQAKILGNYFSKTGLKFHAIYSGSLNRQKATAKAVLARQSENGNRPELRIFPEFDEYDSGAVFTSQLSDMVLEDPSVSEALSNIQAYPEKFRMLFEKAMRRWISGRHDVPDVETWKAFCMRVWTGMAKVMTVCGDDRRIAVFTSAGTLSVVMQMVLELSDEKTMKLIWNILNTSVSAFEYDDDGLSLLGFNSAAHLEMQNDPQLLTCR